MAVSHRVDFDYDKLDDQSTHVMLDIGIFPGQSINVFKLQDHGWEGFTQVRSNRLKHNSRSQHKTARENLRYGIENAIAYLEGIMDNMDGVKENKENSFYSKGIEAAENLFCDNYSTKELPKRTDADIRRSEAMENES